MHETRIVSGIRPDDVSPEEVEREFRALVAAGARLRPAGSARHDPRILLRRGYLPRHRLRLFDTVFHLAELRQEPDARYFVTYVLLDAHREIPAHRRELFVRFFYKDGSLIWRSASHFARSENENWIGKGDLKPVREGRSLVWYTAEETTNLPLEVQGSLDRLSRLVEKPATDVRAIDLVIRRAPDDRVEPYADFTKPRRRAAADPRRRIHGGRRIAWFTRKADPKSLRFARGYEPDLSKAPLDVDEATSRLYGGLVRKYRILSKNQEIQYQFMASPTNVWLVPPQALTTELSSYGVRTVDVEADDDLFVPAREYHYQDDSEDPPRLYSQIPEGFAGDQSVVDPNRADAGPWLEALPVVREFRRVLDLPAPSGTRRKRG
ncbi:hypothetical protein MYXO_00295 [Myxococcaceae bacterium]|jgi:hypothetical protein|nr:hypothetical protein MYXO_00295 [Myxococcaceae bacterium]